MNGCKVDGKFGGFGWVWSVGDEVKWPCCLRCASCGRIFLFDCLEVLLSHCVSLDDVLLG